MKSPPFAHTAVPCRHVTSGQGCTDHVALNFVQYPPYYFRHICCKLSLAHKHALSLHTHRTEVVRKQWGSEVTAELWVRNTQLGSCHSSDIQNSEAVSRFFFLILAWFWVCSHGLMTTLLLNYVVESDGGRLDTFIRWLRPVNRLVYSGLSAPNPPFNVLLTHLLALFD